MNTIILGLGNTILTDDGAGIYVTRLMSTSLKACHSRESGNLTDSVVDPHFRGDDITIKEASLGGFNFIDLLSGFDRAVIIDAIHTKSGTPGEFYELDPIALKPSVRLSSLHGIDFATACEMANQMQVPFPSAIKIFVMEVEDEFTFSEKCTPKVEEALPKMADFIIEALKADAWI